MRFPRPNQLNPKLLDSGPSAMQPREQRKRRRLPEPKRGLKRHSNRYRRHRPITKILIIDQKSGYSTVFDLIDKTIGRWMVGIAKMVKRRQGSQVRTLCCPPPSPIQFEKRCADRVETFRSAHRGQYLNRAVDDSPPILSWTTALAPLAGVFANCPEK